MVSRPQEERLSSVRDKDAFLRDNGKQKRKYYEALENSMFSRVFCIRKCRFLIIVKIA